MIKPIQAKEQAKYDVLSYDSYGYNWTPDVIKDQEIDYTTYNKNLTFGYDRNYIELDIQQDFCIWRCGSVFRPVLYSPLVIKRKEGMGYVDVSHKQIQTSQIDNKTWQKFTEDLPAGIYRISKGIGDRVDSEWWIEKKTSDYIACEYKDNFYFIEQEGSHVHKLISIPKIMIDEFDVTVKSKTIDLDVIISKKEYNIASEDSKNYNQINISRKPKSIFIK